MKRWRISILLMLVMVLCISSLTPLGSVEAGVNNTIVGEDTYKNNAYWYCPEDDVLTDNKKLIFTKDSTEDTKFVSRHTINANKDSGEFLVVECNIKFTAIPRGKKFVIGLGVQEMEPYLGDEKSIELAFSNNGGVKLSVSAFPEAGKETVLCREKSSGISINNNAYLRVSIDGNSVLNVSMNGAKVYSGKLPVDGSGRVAFLQTGGCQAEIDDLSIVGKEYARPENTNVFEDFEQGVDVSKIKFPNTAILGWEWRFPKTAAVKEYNGNKVFMLVNAGGYYFTSKYQYSNFEITFDVPFVQRMADLTIDDGTGYFREFALLFGIPGNGEADYYSSEATDKILFERKQVSSAHRKEFATPYDYIQAEEFKPFSVKLSVVDGVVTVGMKLTTEKNFETLGQYTIRAGSTTGYIRFAIPERATMAIDNIKITNLDDNPNLITTTYQNGIVTFEDAQYVPFERVYQTDAEQVSGETSDAEQVSGETSEKTPTFSWYLLIPGAGLLGLAIFVISIGIATRKGKMKKEVIADET